MFGTSRIFRSEDASAPQLKWVAGTLNTVLKAVLVNGYGTTESLGWTLEFEDVASNTCVFRMKGGTRTYIQVTDATAQYAKIRAYETMSSVFNGMGPCPPLIDTTSNTVHKSIGVAATVRPWRIIGDDAGIYILTAVSGVVPYSGNTQAGLLLGPHYIGDYVPFRTSIKNNFCVVLSNNSLYGFNPVAAFSQTPGAYVMRNITNEFGSVPMGLNGCNAYSVAMFGNNTPQPLPIMTFTNTLVHIPAVAATTTTPLIPASIVGKLPGLFNPYFSYEGSGVNFTNDNNLIEFLETDGGETGLVITYGNGNQQIYCGSQQRIMITIGDKFRNA